MTQRTVVIAVDASAHSKSAFDYYIENVKKPDDMVVVCHIPESPHLPTFSIKRGLAPPIQEWQKALTDQIDKVRKLEEYYEAELVGKKLSYKVKFDQMKNPGEGIVAISEAEGARMVVMGTRGLDVIRRTLLGSVSDYVVRHSKVPVLVCPSKLETPPSTSPSTP